MLNRCPCCVQEKFVKNFTFSAERPFSFLGQAKRQPSFVKIRQVGKAFCVIAMLVEITKTAGLGLGWF
jgi:hypothetical protein